MVVQGCHRSSLSRGLKVTYTNINGLILSLLEFKDYLKTDKLDVVCVTEAKLKEEIKVELAKEGYNTWRRVRKGKGEGGGGGGGGGVMILVKEDIVVEQVEYGDGMEETMSVVIKT